MLLTLSMFVMVMAASAQTELPAIDEAEAEAFLGTWYMDRMCEGESCIKASDFGMKGELIVSADNTMTISFGTPGEEPRVINWYMKDGIAYIISVNEKDNSEEHSAIRIDENGELVLFESEKDFMTFSRETAAAIGTGPVKEDAALEDFSGEWHLNSILSDGSTFPTSIFGMTGTLVIRENSLDATMFGEATDTDLPFEFSGGKIHAVSVSKNEKGETVEAPFTLEYHEEGAVVMIMDEGKENETRMVYVRQENLTNPDLSILTGGAGTESGGEVKLTPEEEAELEALLKQLETESANGQEGGLNLSGLLSTLLSGQTGEGGLDLSGLLQSVTGGQNGEGGLDLSGLLQSVTNGQNGEGGLDLSGLLNSVTNGQNGEGGLDLSDLLNTVTNGQNGEGGLDLSGLLNSVTNGQNGEGGLNLSGLLNTVTSGSETQK